MRKAPENNDNIENKHQQPESSINNPELINTRKNQHELEEEKKKQAKEQLNSAERLKQNLKEGDTNGILSNFLKYINYINNNGQPKDISKELDFLKNSQYIEQTKKEYIEKFETTKKLLKETDILSKISEISNIKAKGGDISHNIHDLKHQKVFKNIMKLQKYEKGELISFPNGMVFELEKGKIAESSITDFYIKTHVEKGTGHYMEYVKSLLTARKLFKNKGINIKYCRRETRLANREFIEAYERIRKIKKERRRKSYEKSNILKVLEQTEQAVICEKAKEINREKPDKNPIRFLKKGSDLYNFAIDEGKKTGIFRETEMWLDLDKLEITNSLKEKNDYIIENYEIEGISINKILNKDTKLKKILNIFIKRQKIENEKDKIKEIIHLIHKMGYTNENGETDHRKININGKISGFSCGHKALLLEQIFKEHGEKLGITEHYIARPNGHAMNIVKFKGRLHIIDSSLGTYFQDIEDNFEIEKKGNINVLRLNNPIDNYRNPENKKNYTVFPIINIGSKISLYGSSRLEAYDLSVKEKMYQKAGVSDYESLKSYVNNLKNSNELNPLNYFTGEEYLGIAKDKKDREYELQIKELDYLMNDTRSLKEIQEKMKIIKDIKLDLNINEEYLEEIVKEDK